MGNSLSVQGKKGKGNQKGVVVTNQKETGKGHTDSSLEHGDVYKECDSEGLPESLRSPEDTLEGEEQTAQSPGYACSSVQGMRNGMEDQHVAARPLIDNHQGKHDVHLFGVFDGHGGTRCAQFLKQSLATAVKQSIAGASDSVEEALRRAFMEVDSQFCTEEAGDAREEGSTAVVVVIVGKTLYCANTGDSRAVLCRADMETKALSHDHKPSRPDEKQRIEQLGGCVLYNRVMGRLGVSRAFGDKSLKQYVTAEPEVVSVELTEGDEMLILACDGLWDVADMDTAGGLARTHSKSKGLRAAAQALTTYAVRNGSNDNVTAMVVGLAGWTSK